MLAPIAPKIWRAALRTQRTNLAPANKVLFNPLKTGVSERERKTRILAILYSETGDKTGLRLLTVGILRQIAG